MGITGNMAPGSVFALKCLSIDPEGLSSPISV